MIAIIENVSKKKMFNIVSLELFYHLCLSLSINSFYFKRFLRNFLKSYIEAGFFKFKFTLVNQNNYITHTQNNDFSSTF